MIGLKRDMLLLCIEKDRLYRLFTRLFYIVLLVFIPLFFSGISAQNQYSTQKQEIKIWGSVKDNHGEPIAGAGILLNPYMKGGMSNYSGEYNISIELDGNDSLLIEASCLGFYPEKHYLKNRSQRIDFVLREKTTALNDVVITAQRGVRRTKDVPELVRLISKSDISGSQAQSLSDLLSLELPGLEFTSTEGTNNQISLNGFGSKYVLFLIDGERMSGETARENVDYNRIDIDQIERIEIVQGGMSTLYGSGAIAGVVNIITSKVGKPWSVKLNARYSTEGEQKYGLSLGFKKNDFWSHTSGSYKRKTAFFMQSSDSMRRTYSDGSIDYEAFLPEKEVEGFSNYSITQKLGFKYGKGDKQGSEISLNGSFYEHERFNAQPEGSLLHHLYRDGMAGLKWIHVLDTVSSIELSYSFDDYMKYNKYLRLEETEKNYEAKTHNARLLYRANFPYRNRFLAGIEIFNEQLNTYQFAANGRYGQTGLWAYVQDDWQALDWLTVSGGVRFEYSNEHGFMAVPKLNLMARTKDFTFRLGYASGFRTPTLKEMYTNWDHQGMFVLMGNEYLNPEKSYNISAGAEYNASWWSIGVNAHYHYLTDKITTVWNSSQDTSFYINAQTAQLAGLNFYTDWQLPLGFSIKAAYAFVYDFQLQDGMNVAAYRPHSANMKLEYRHRWRNHGLSARIGGRFLSSMDVQSYDEAKKMWYSLRYDPYFLLNFEASMQFPYGVQLSVGVDNMLNYKPRYVTYNAYLTKGVSFSVGLSWDIDEIYPYKERKNK